MDITNLSLIFCSTVSIFFFSSGYSGPNVLELVCVLSVAKVIGLIWVSCFLF